jgi:hypothetical protein
VTQKYSQNFKSIHLYISVIPAPPHQQLSVQYLTLIKQFSSFCHESGNGTSRPEKSCNTKQGKTTTKKQIRDIEMHKYSPIRQAVLFHVSLQNMTNSSMLTQPLQFLTPAEHLLAL